MRSDRGGRAARLRRFRAGLRGLGSVCVLGLCFGAAGCTTDSAPGLVHVAMRAPTITFESIDGPPAAVFTKFVAALAAEAEARQILVVSRQTAAVYRVRVYVAANVVEGRTHYDWVWDVYDADQRRTLRIAGEEPGAGRAQDAWSALDDQTLMRIARVSMDRLARSLALPGTTPPTSPSPTLASAFAEERNRGLTPAALQTGLAGADLSSARTSAGR